MINLLQGLRIIDLTTVVLGPYATRFLGDFGADVVKVEPPDGDLFRSADVGRSVGMGAAFMNCNRNKRSISLDLKNPAGRAILHRLVGTGDVLVHNMRPRSAKKLGADYETVKQYRRDIVYCYSGGFGEGGTMSDEPAYDDSIQALSGLACINANEKGEPRYLPTVVCDKVAGLHLAVAILAGVTARERCGQGVCMEAPMFESVVSFLLAEHLSGESFVPPVGKMGYQRLTSPFRKPFRSKDGYVSIIPYSKDQWTKFLQLVGREDVAGSDVVCNAAERSRNIDALYELVADVAPTRTTSEWISLLRERDIPCATVNRTEDLLTNRHLQDVGMFEYADHPTEKHMRNVRSPFSAAGFERGEDRPAPILGADGRAVLEESGFSAAEIEEAVLSGALTLPAAARN